MTRRAPRTGRHAAGTASPSKYPAVVAAYDALSEVCRDAGPLDPATVALVALPTIGLPAALDALRWVDESIREARSPRASTQRHDWKSDAADRNH